MSERTGQIEEELASRPRLREKERRLVESLGIQSNVRLEGAKRTDGLAA